MCEVQQNKRQFRFEPYDTNNVQRFELPTTEPSTAAAAIINNDCSLPKLHTELEGRVRFVPYPAEGVEVPATTAPREKLARLFIGQLPYGVTDMQLAWLCCVVADQRPVFNIERIIKWNNGHQPKGCVHAYCNQEDADYLIATLNRRVLVDDVGVWYAEDEAQRMALENYCAEMKTDPRKRFRERPYQPVVVQRAMSTFVLRRSAATSPVTPQPPAYPFAAMPPPPPPPPPPAYNASFQQFNQFAPPPPPSVPQQQTRCYKEESLDYLRRDQINLLRYSSYTSGSCAPILG